MNDETEILKRQFWNSIKPFEPHKQKVLEKCSIKISSTNMTASLSEEIDDWGLIGLEDKLVIDFYDNKEYCEFSFGRCNNLIDPLKILSNYAVRIEIKNQLFRKKVYFYNNNNEFYLFNNRYYFKSLECKTEFKPSLFVMTYFVTP